MPDREFRVFVSKDSLVFSSAHFITFAGHRCEPLHGHNYRVAVALEGELDTESHYVFDFIALRDIMQRLCAAIDHKMLLPLENRKLAIVEHEASVSVSYEGEPRYVFPRGDCALLPVPNTTVEMLAELLATRLRAELGKSGANGVKTIELEVEENFGQSATCRMRI